MTDRIVVTRNGAIVFDSAPDTQPAAGSAPANVLTGTLFGFDWGAVGEVLYVQMAPGNTYSFYYDVPATYFGPCGHAMVPTVGTPDNVSNLRIWESGSEAGPEILDTVYEGSWISQGGPMPNPQFLPTGGARYYFNVTVSASGVFGVRQLHN